MIENIENLTNLIHLEDLSLFHNRIVQVDREELEPLRNLNSLSLGYNKINDVHKLGQALRGLTRLQILNVKSNPLEMDGEYRAHLIKFLP
jgi:hypothetical protein